MGVAYGKTAYGAAYVGSLWGQPMWVAYGETACGGAYGGRLRGEGKWGGAVGEEAGGW